MHYNMFAHRGTDVISVLRPVFTTVGSKLLHDHQASIHPHVVITGCGRDAALFDFDRPDLSYSSIS
jgi:hypothetical protein